MLFRVFNLRIALNLLKYPLFSHTAHMSCRSEICLDKETSQAILAKSLRNACEKIVFDKF